MRYYRVKEATKHVIQVNIKVPGNNDIIITVIQSRYNWCKFTYKYV